MGCDVCISGDYDGALECTTLEILKCRKPVRCGECRKVVEKGEQYERYAGKWEGEWFVARTCLLCAEIRASFYCDGGTLDTLWDDMRDLVFDNPDFSTASDCFRKLSAAAKERVLEEWRAWKGIQR